MSNTTKNKRLAQGLCGWCGKQPVRPNRVTCKDCGEKHVAHNKNKHKELMEKGLCTCCGKGVLVSKRLCENCIVSKRTSAAKYYQKIKDAVFQYYGGYVCACCGETINAFLSIDHVNGGGKKHREDINTDFYRWLKQNNFPEGYQVLCMNCQFGRKKYGICPHQA